MTTHTAPSMPVDSAAVNSSAAGGAWVWLAPYMVIIFVLLLLGSLLGDLSLFKRATLGTDKLTASQLVKLFSYGGALFMVWLIAQRSTLQLRMQGGRTGFLGSIVVAVAVLTIVSFSYSVLLIALKPLLASGPRKLYDWLFVLGISACAMWLVVALFRNSDSIIKLFTSSTAAPQASACGKCNQPLPGNAQFCSGCGTSVS
ncbi:MAG: zinc ribbon domain-containing protein [Burkholderiales bacterium]